MNLRTIFATFAVAVVIVVGVAQLEAPMPKGDAEAMRGLLLLEERQYQAAANCLERAIQEGTDEYSLAMLQTCLGNAYSELERYDDAIKMHTSAVAQDPTLHQAWVNLGIVYRLTGQYEKAEESYRTALEIKPDYAELHASLGALYLLTDRHEDAMASLQRSIKLDPTMPVAHSNLAMGYAMQGEFDKAEASLLRAEELGYPNGKIMRERISALWNAPLKE